MPSFTTGWDETKPAGSRNLNLGDDDIREFKQQVRERCNVDGYFPSSDDTSTGYHRKSTFMEQASDPAQVADTLILYSKLTGSYSELYSRHENAAIQQLTLNGKLWIEALTVASIAQGDIFYYDGTKVTRLGSGTSGQFLKTQGASANPAWSSISGSYTNGSFRNLKVTRASVSTVTLTADEVLVDDGSGTVQRLTSINLTGDMAISGAGGLDTGTENPSTWYYIFLIAKTDGTKKLLLSSSSTSPTMPSGYTYKVLLTAVRNDSSSDFVNFIQEGLHYEYNAWQTIASGNVGYAAWTSIDTTAYIPSALSTRAKGVIHPAAGSGSVVITNDSSVSVGNTADRNKVGINIGSGDNIQEINWEFSILTANTLYWGSDNAGCFVRLAGFEINKLV